MTETPAGKTNATQPPAAPPHENGTIVSLALALSVAVASGPDLALAPTYGWVRPGTDPASAAMPMPVRPRIATWPAIDMMVARSVALTPTVPVADTVAAPRIAAVTESLITAIEAEPAKPVWPPPPSAMVSASISAVSVALTDTLPAVAAAVAVSMVAVTLLAM